MKIGILTGGGDVPGLNPAIKTVASRGEAEGHEVIGFRRGWMGLLHLNPDDPESVARFSQPLNHRNTRRIDRTGGTFLHTSRVNPGRVAVEKIPDFLTPSDGALLEDGCYDFTGHVVKVLDRLGVNVLIPIGGEDTLGFASRLHRAGVPMVSIPKTMDNDVYGTDFCIGFATAVTRSVNFIHQLRSCTGSHERIAVIELFGRHSGETSLISAYLAGADRACISEVPFNPERLAELVMLDKLDNPSNYAIITLSEGANMVGGDLHQSGEPDAFGHQKLGGVGQATANVLEELTGEKTLVQNLAYLMRSGSPDSLDIMVAINFANCAMDLIGRGEFGRMVALRHGVYSHVEGDMPLKGEKRVDVDALYDQEDYRPKIKLSLGMPMFLY